MLECSSKNILVRGIALVITWALGIRVSHYIDMMLIEMLNIFTNAHINTNPDICSLKEQTQW